MSTATTRLTGEEPWVKASKEGAIIFVRFWGDKISWWPLVLIDLDTGLGRIDVCGQTQNMHLDDCAQLRIEMHGEPIDQENFYETGCPTCRGYHFVVNPFDPSDARPCPQCKMPMP